MKQVQKYNPSGSNYFPFRNTSDAGHKEALNDFNQTGNNAQR